MRVKTKRTYEEDTPCLRHRNRLIIAKCTPDSSFYYVSGGCPSKMVIFLARLCHDKELGYGIIDPKYNKYIEALLMGCSLSQVLKRMREDHVL